MRELSQLRLDGGRAASGFVRERRAAESCQYRRGAETRRPWGAGPEYQRAERTDKRAEKKKVDSRSQRVSSSRWLVGFSPAAPARPAGPSVGCEALKPMRHAAEVQHEPSQVLFVRHQPPDCTATCAWTAGGVLEEAAADTSRRLCKKKKIIIKTQRPGLPEARSRSPNTLPRMFPGHRCTTHRRFLRRRLGLFNRPTFQTETHACQVDEMMQRADSSGRNSTRDVELGRLGELKVGGELRVCGLGGQRFLCLHLCITHQVSGPDLALNM